MIVPLRAGDYQRGAEKVVSVWTTDLWLFRLERRAAFRHSPLRFAPRVYEDAETTVAVGFHRGVFISKDYAASGSHC